MAKISSYFKMCKECSKNFGRDVLCESCSHNRDLINRLTNILKEPALPVVKFKVELVNDKGVFEVRLPFEPRKGTILTNPFLKVDECEKLPDKIKLRSVLYDLKRNVFTAFYDDII